MRKLIVGTLIWGAIGAVLNSGGITYTTWQFWVILALVFATELNETYNRD